MNLDFLRDDSRFTEAIRDPVWKHIWLTPEFREIAQTQPFQRLFRIKQLGPAELVYPGATHSRAAHSFGVYHVSLRLLRVLLQRGADSWVTAEGCVSFLAAALLHDLGHFPFTHALKELSLIDHESLTARLILTETMKQKIRQAGASPEMTAAFIDKQCTASPGSETAFFRNLLSGVLDPDKLDYLNRDAYYCGVPYGIQDTDFLLSKVQCDPNRGIMLDSRSIMAVESVLFSKYLMYRTVYWHRQVRIATAMMKKCIFTALNANLISAETLYDLDDYRLYTLIEGLRYPEKEIASLLGNQTLYGVVAEFRFDQTDASHIQIENLSIRAHLEKNLAEILSTSIGSIVPAWHVLIDLPERVSFESDLYVTDERRVFSASSTVFSKTTVSSFTDSLRIIRIAVHPGIFNKVTKITGLTEKLAKSLEVG